jgi:hypothetical protein
MSSEIDLFRQHVKAQYELGQPAAEADVAEFEANNGVRLPVDVREYFLKVNGADDGWTVVYPLEKWRLLKQYFEADDDDSEWIDKLSLQIEHPEKYFSIGTYDIYVWYWFIKLDSDAGAETPVIVLFQDKVVEKVAESLTDFLYKFRTEAPEYLLHGR